MQYTIIYRQSRLLAATLFVSAALTACGGGGGGGISNSAPSATGVSITDENGGDAIIGDQLTGSYTYSDFDSDTEGTSTFRWLRGGVAIIGATALNYTLVGSDYDQTITFEVTPVAATGKSTGSPVVSGGMTAIDNAPTATNVTFTDDNAGQPLVGDSLTGSYTYSDLESDIEGTSTFRWSRNDVAISGATMRTYTLVSGDYNQTIAFEVTPVAVSGNTTGTPVVSAGMIINSAPTVSGVTLTDDNGGYAVAGDNLTGTYTYADVDSDAEGTSTFRWLRNDNPIGSAIASTYILVQADVNQEVTFEVTPVAATGFTNGTPVTSAALATGEPPVVSGMARYLDTNINATNDAGDQLIVPFDQQITVNTVFDTDLTLPVTNDTFGTGATVTAGPEAKEITITLGTTPTLTTSGDYSGAALTAGSPSGVDVSGMMTADAIEGFFSAFDAIASTPIDVIPGFVDSAQSLGSNTSFGIALGDVNADGHLDMVVANSGQGNAVYLNNGTGTFADTGQSLGTYDSMGVALGDIDGDLDLDMVVANHIGQANRVYLNDGSGTFTDSGQMLGANYSQTTALGDVDMDGDQDMIVGNGIGQANRIYTNDGVGNFTDSGQRLGASNSWGLGLGDVNGDNKLDLVVANGAGDPNRVYTNDGSGIFTDSGQSLGGNSTEGIALGDVNGDSHLDMVVANYYAEDLIYINNGTGSFTDSGQLLSGSLSRAVTLGDIDGDGDLEMVVARGAGRSNLVYINNGTGTFTDSGQTLGSSTSRLITLGDLDKDGDLDMAVGNLRESNVVYMGSLSGTP